MTAAVTAAVTVDHDLALARALDLMREAAATLAPFYAGLTAEAQIAVARLEAMQATLAAQPRPHGPTRHRR